MGRKTRKTAETRKEIQIIDTDQGTQIRDEFLRNIFPDLTVPRDMKSMKKILTKFLELHGFFRKDQTQKCIVILDLLDSIPGHVELQNLLFNFFEGEGISREIFVTEISGQILEEKDIQKRNLSATILLDVILNIAKAKDEKCLFLKRAVNNFQVESCDTVVDALVFGLCVGDGKNRENIELILGWLKASPYPESIKFNIYSRLIQFEFLKENNRVSLGFLSEMFLVVQEMCRSKDFFDVTGEYLQALEYKYYRKYFEYKGFEFSQNSYNIDFPKFIEELLEVASALLAKAESFEHVSFKGLLLFYNKIEHPSKQEFQAVITNFLYARFAQINSEAKIFLRENSASLLDPRQLIEFMGDNKLVKENEHLAKFIIFNWSKNFSDFWYKVSQLDSAQHVDMVLNFANNLPKHYKDSTREGLIEHLGSSYLLFRGFANQSRNERSDTKIECEKILELLADYQKSSDDQDLKVKYAYIEFLREEYANEQGLVTIKNLPEATELDKKFLFFLAKENRFDDFVHVLSVHLRNPKIDEIVVYLKEKFCNLDKENPAHCYGYFLDKLYKSDVSLSGDKQLLYRFLLGDLIDLAEGKNDGENAIAMLHVLKAAKVVQSGSSYVQDPPKKILADAKSSLESLIPAQEKQDALKKKRKFRDQKNKIMLGLVKSLAAEDGEKDPFSVLGKDIAQDNALRIKLLRQYFLVELTKDISSKRQKFLVHAIDKILGAEQSLYELKLSNIEGEGKIPSELADSVRDIEEARKVFEGLKKAATDKLELRSAKKIEALYRGYKVRNKLAEAREQRKESISKVVSNYVSMAVEEASDRVKSKKETEFMSSEDKKSQILGKQYVNSLELENTRLRAEMVRLQQRLAQQSEQLARVNRSYFDVVANIKQHRSQEIARLERELQFREEIHLKSVQDLQGVLKNYQYGESESIARISYKNELIAVKNNKIAEIEGMIAKQNSHIEKIKEMQNALLDKKSDLEDRCKKQEDLAKERGISRSFAEDLMFSSMIMSGFPVDSVAYYAALLHTSSSGSFRAQLSVTDMHGNIVEIPGYSESYIRHHDFFNGQGTSCTNQSFREELDGSKQNIQQDQDLGY